MADRFGLDVWQSADVRAAAHTLEAQLRARTAGSLDVPLSAAAVTVLDAASLYADWLDRAGDVVWFCREALCLEDRCGDPAERAALDHDPGRCGTFVLVKESQR